MKEDIEICCSKNVLSHIYSGTSIEDAAYFCQDCGNIFMVIDRNLPEIQAKLEKVLPFKGIFPIEATEEKKTIQTVMDICTWLMDRNADRSAFVLGVGGGITTDLTGMAASIYKRGLDFAFIPTTLLAQTDAAIGGKNGVNIGGYKNMAGVIRQPRFTFECAEVLLSLPYDELLGGAAEMIKSFIIDDRGDHYRQAIRLFSSIHSATNRPQAIRERQAELRQLIMAAAGIKAGIVSRDQDECGERKKLNLGHTFAHAIEWKSGNRIPHGKAVAIGMVMAARLAEVTGSAAPGLAAQIRTDLESCGLPVQCPYPMEDLAQAMEKDKKSRRGAVDFILPRQIGDVSIRHLAIQEVLKLENMTKETNTNKSL